MLLKLFSPPTADFFKLFVQSSDKFSKASREFLAMTKDLKNVKQYATRISDLEHEADEITHTTVELLHKTFITPFDRDDIYSLISKMDDVVDFINATAQRFLLYKIESVPDDFIKMSELCVTCSDLIAEAVGFLNNLKDPTKMLTVCVRINEIENEADSLYRAAMAKLFEEESDFKNLIKYKEVYELIETVTDRCEDVANVIEGIVLEYS